ncbi:MAG: LytTR family transcriptional regulator [Cytophagales bacterium]|jgi:hypothetical protein|nr:LytTR family transcriptional regulator [Cytophagales bacterium]
MNVTYRDRPVMIIGSLLLGYFIVNVGQTDSVFTLWSQPFYIRDIIGASVIVAVVWWLVRTATVWLDRRHDWFGRPVRRILGQLLIGFLGPVAVSVLLALLYYQFVVEQPIDESTYPIYEFPISVLIILGMNLLYLGLYLYHKATSPSVSQPETAPITNNFRKTLIVNSGLRNIPIAVEEVAYVYIDDATVFLNTFSGSKYVINSSLDELAGNLPENTFFRANRQFILHRRACRSYLNDTYGKLKVEVEPALPKDIIVSQQKAPDFKNWLENGF